MRQWIVLLFLTSCSLFIGGGNDGPKTAKGSLYSVHFGAPSWVYKKDERSDYIFENANDGRILLSNSFCEEFQDLPLEKLAGKTFNTVKEFKSTVSEYTTFQHREAYRLEGHGLVDGVKVYLRLLNTRRNNCYFDFVSIDPFDTVKSTDTAFKDFLDSVVFR